MYIVDVVGRRTSYELLHIAHVNTNMLGKRQLFRYLRRSKQCQSVVAGCT